MSERINASAEEIQRNSFSLLRTVCVRRRREIREQLVGKSSLRVFIIHAAAPSIACMCCCRDFSELYDARHRLLLCSLSLYSRGLWTHIFFFYKNPKFSVERATPLLIRCDSIYLLHVIRSENPGDRETETVQLRLQCALCLRKIFREKLAS